MWIFLVQKMSLYPDQNDIQYIHTIVLCANFWQKKLFQGSFMIILQNLYCEKQRIDTHLRFLLFLSRSEKKSLSHFMH